MSDAPKSIFAGAKLTEQTRLAQPGPDQRLFTRPAVPPPPAAGDHLAPAEAPTEPPPADSPAAPRKVDTYKPRNIGTKEPKKVGQAAAPAHSTAPTATPRFDFDLRPGRQANFVFTDEELDALEDVKRDARRTHGLATTKQDIVRYAVLDLLEDFAANGEGSRLIRWLQQRPHRR